MRRLVLLFLSVVSALALVAPVTQAKVSKDFIGVQDDTMLTADDNYRTTNFSTMAAIGVGTDRQVFRWSEMEPTPGQYDFSLYDRFVSKASSHGVKILPVVFGPPKFRMKSGPAKFTCQPKSNAAFGSFVARLAKRYGTKGTFWTANPQLKKTPITTWQIWNEPNLKPYWCGKPNAKQYVGLLKAANKSLKKADKKAEVVTAGMPQSKLGIPLLKYIGQMYKAGGKKAFDTLAIHPYSNTVPELRKRLRDVRKIMNKGRDRSAKIWVTELAWSDVGPSSKFRVGKSGQAKRITDAYKLIGKERKRLKLRGAIYVYWRDLKPYPPNYTDFWGLHTGLIRQDGSFKKSFYAFKQVISKLK